METLFILNRDRIDRQGLYENTPVGGNVPILRNDQYRVKQEKILRTSLTSGFLNDQIIELGVEVAINNYDQIFNQEKYTAGIYSLSTDDDVSVKENRYEFFANHTYNISPKMVLQSSLAWEFSRINSLTVPISGGAIPRNKKFSFLKPRADFRYDLTANDQFRASVERKISQLDFQNFVAIYDADLDRLRPGNTGIVPEKSWNYSAAFEHRLANDGGALQVEFFYRDIKDYIDLVDFTEFFDASGAAIARANLDFISVSGNIASARSYGLKTAASLRFGFIGLPEAVFSIDHKWEKSKVTDQFSGVRRMFIWTPEHKINFNFRHDVTKWNFSYGGSGTIQSVTSGHEIDQVQTSYNGDNYEVFAEIKIFGDMKLIFKFEHLTPLRYNIDTPVYKDHIRYNELDRFENRIWKYVREYSVFLQGTF